VPKPKKLTQAQILLQIHLKELGIETTPEYRFNPNRQWRFDLADLLHKVGYECDGGAFSGGHRRGRALEADYERQNWAIAHDWKVIRFSNRQVFTGEAQAFVKRYLDD
jgi:very-short-patch-repair endonuclease